MKIGIVILGIGVAIVGCATLPAKTGPLTRLVYVADSRPETIAEVKAAGFQGYIAYDVKRAVLFDPPSDTYAYYDEPEDNPERYKAWRAEHAEDRRLVAYGNVDLAKKRGVWSTDHTLVAHHLYPYKGGGWFLTRWWQVHVAHPFHLWQWKRAVQDSETPVVGTLQAFGYLSDPESWVFPGCERIRDQERWWRRMMGGQLVGIAYFIWSQPGTFEGLRDHPECWPVNQGRAQ